MTQSQDWIDTTSFHTANDDETIYATAEDCYDVLKRYDKVNVKKMLIVVVPFGIPGSGKSTFLKTMREVTERLGWSLDSVSSDATRGECMEQYIEKNPESTRKEAFDNTNKPASKAFDQKLATRIRASSKSKSPVHVLFVDKNHPPNGIPKTMNLISINSPDNFLVRKLYLIPSITHPIK